MTARGSGDAAAIWMVQGIEHFQAELRVKPIAVAPARVLDRREVQVVVAGIPHAGDHTRSVPDRVRCRSNERRGIECVVGSDRIPDQAWSLREGQQCGTRCAVVERWHNKRGSIRVSVDPVYLPTRDKQICESVHMARQRVPLPEGQFIDNTGNQDA